LGRAVICELLISAEILTAGAAALPAARAMGVPAARIAKAEKRAAEIERGRESE
jgi:hypothetical protein